MRLSVVSPFLDRQHGTELCLIEQIERLAKEAGWTIDLYSQRVEQVDGVRPAPSLSNRQQGDLIWHRVSDLGGLHLCKYLWWFVANQRQRRRDQRLGMVKSDLVYSPGINCLDADVIVVHMVFHAFYERVGPELSLRRAALRSWPRIIHRKLYYRLIMSLERRIYRDPRVRLIAVSSLVAKQLEAFFGRQDVAVIPNAVDTRRFGPKVCRERRAESLRVLQFADNDFVVLLIGNDWKKKGLDSLLRATAKLQELPLKLLVVGNDDPKLYYPLIEALGLKDRVQFEKPSADVLQFYAAADVYAGPSLEDAFNLPILEAMACGLPVVASVHTGASENITEEETGLILRDPQNDELLARLMRRLYEDKELREKIGKAAAAFVRANCSWDQNAERTREFLEAVYLSRRER